MYRISWCIMPVLRILILILISRAASVEFSMTKNANNYGPYTTKFYNYKLCQGPRSKNVTIASTTLDVDKYGAIGNYNVTFTVPAKLDVFKVAVWNVKGDQKNLLWNYKVNKPCQHFVITGILEQTFREMHNCVIPPGPYFVGFKYFGTCPHSENNLGIVDLSVTCELNAYKAVINTTLSQAVRIIELKVVIHSIKGNHKNQLWDFSIEKPCLNRIISGALKPHVDVRTCVLRKGTHNAAINLSEAVYLFFGSSFFYGEYLAKFTLVSTRKQPILCVITDELIHKKHSTKSPNICHIPDTELKNTYNLP